MKITKLSIQNLMRVSAVEITPDGNIVKITGKNGAGKTSVLNGIAFALGGKRLIPEKPIKDGETSAQVTVVLDDYTVIRKWTSNGSSLKIQSKDGAATYSSPQVMLDKLIGKLSFDPLEFTRMAEKTQKEVLLGLVDLGIDLDDLAKERQEYFDKRAGINRDLRDKEGELSGMEKPSLELADDEVSVSKLIQEFGEASKTNLKNKEERDKFADIENEIEGYRAEIGDLQEKMEQAKEGYSMILEKHKKQKGIVSSLSDVNTQEIQDKISSAEEENTKIRSAQAQNKAIKAIEMAVNELKEKSDTLTTLVSACDIKKQTSLQKATFPVKGLSVNENGVTWNDFPFGQASSAEQLRVSLAIAMALNPKLKVVGITDGSLLDSDSMAIIEQMAKEKDYQIWVEIVDESGKVGIVIEDGMIKAVDGEELQEAV